MPPSQSKRSHAEDSIVYVLFSPWEKHFAAHKALDGLSSVNFIPVFRTAKDARAYRDNRLQWPALRVRKMRME